MRKTTVIAKRELASVFTSPLAYVWGAAFLLLVGVLFALNFMPGEEASLRELFTDIVLVMVLAVPLLTMPLLSEEYARGTIESMMTAPVTELDVVLGKFAGALGFYVLLLGATLLHLALLWIFGEPELGQALIGYLGMLLVGAMFISIGLFFSSVTRYQLLAALLTAVVLAALTLLPLLLRLLTTGRLRRIIDTVSVTGNFEPFSKGWLESQPVVYFLSITAFFLFITVKVLESRRWR